MVVGTCGSDGVVGVKKHVQVVFNARCVLALVSMV